jgi:MFS family permease
LLSAVDSIWICRIGLFLMGLGSAFAFVGTLKLAAAIIVRKHLGLASGITTALGMLGAIFGQSITAYFNLHYHWQYTWLFYAMGGIIIVIAFSLFIKEPVLINPDIALVHSRHIFKQLYQLAKNKTVLLCGLIGAVLYMPVAVFGSLWGVPYLTNLSSNITTLAASNTVAMVFLGMVIGCPLAGFLARYIAGEKILIVSSLAAVMLNVLLIINTSSSLLWIGAILFLTGLICGAEVLTFSMAVDKSPKHLAASAVALVNFIMMAICGLMQYIVGLTLDYCWTGKIINGLPVYDASMYRVAMSTVPLLSALVTLIFICGIWQSSHNRN